MKKRWSHDDNELMRELYPTTPMQDLVTLFGASERAIYSRAEMLGIKKAPAYYATHIAGRLGNGQGKETQFKKGQEPWNKGIAFDSGGRSHETRFRPGSRPHTWHPVGYERITADGYRERKMTDTGNTRRDFVAVHVLLWREHVGEVPEGHAVVFRNGDKTDIRIENLECISRAELMRRNSYHNNYPKDVQLLIQLRGAVSRQINKRKEATK